MLIIMDRDGVINYDSPDYIKSPKEWRPIPRSLNAITRLNHAGCQVVIASNQSGVGRGYYSLEVLEEIHQKMRDALSAIGGRIDGIYFCPHTPDDGCECRKPKPGMLIQIAKDFSANLRQAYFIGDSMRDIRAAQQVGCQPILVRTGNGEKTLAEHRNELRHVPIYADLSEAAGIITTLIMK